jgi:hypothetical protein
MRKSMTFIVFSSLMRRDCRVLLEVLLHDGWPVADVDQKEDHRQQYFEHRLNLNKRRKVKNGYLIKLNF